MAGALAHAHPPEQAEPPRARLSLVKPRSRPMPRDLRTAWILSTFNGWLSLDVRDARQLEKAFGWAPETSLRLGVRSTPGAITNAVLGSELRALVGESEAWPPGFYLDEETGALKLDCPHFGLLVPVWRRWPVGWQSYRSAGDTRPRWITSADRATGSPATASVHCVGTAEDERVFMVAHTLEAMAVSVRQRVAAVGFNGAAVGTVPAQLFEAYPRLTGVVLAMKDPPPRLESELRAAGLAVTTWQGGALL